MTGERPAGDDLELSVDEIRDLDVPEEQAADVKGGRFPVESEHVFSDLDCKTSDCDEG